MKFSTYQTPLVLILFCLNISQAQIISPFSPKSLSYPYLKTISQSVNDSMLGFYSSPQSFMLPQEKQFLSVNIAKQNITFNPYVIAGVEYAYDKAFGFPVIGGSVGYASKHLSAKAMLEVYTKNGIQNSTLFDKGYSRFDSKTEEPISGGIDFDFNMPEAWLALTFNTASVSIGKQTLRWGPGYVGTLGLSGTGFSPFYYYNINVNIGKVIHCQSFLAGYDDEALFEDEFKQSIYTHPKDTVQNDINQIPARYGAGRRLDIQLGKAVQIGVYGLVDFFGSNELTRYANPLQLYYVGNRASKTNNANQMGGCDINVVIKPVRWYAEFLNDDITIFDKNGNPDKWAWQTGLQYCSDKLIKNVGIEYSHISPYIYGHSRVLNRHAYRKESLGWPFGNDMDVFNAHAILALSQKVNAKAEMTYCLKGDGTIWDDWYVDSRPNRDNAPYWPENSDRIFSIRANVNYHPIPWVTIDVSLQPLWENGDMQFSCRSYVKVEFPTISRRHTRPVMPQ